MKQHEAHCRYFTGVDIVEIKRFASWHKKTLTQLSRVFSSKEIEYSKSIGKKTSERFAGRFAAREALYKALAPLQQSAPAPFLAFCRAVTITTTLYGLIVDIEEKFLNRWYQKDFRLNFALSISHTSSIAIATAIVHVNNNCN